MLLKVPGGRIYCFYNHNTDNLRAARADNPPYRDGLCTRVDSLGHFVYKYSDDHGRSWSSRRYDIPIREMDIDRRNAYGGEIQFFWNVGKPFTHDGAAYVSVHKVGGFGEGFFTRSEGVLLKSTGLLSSATREIRWETLPDGDYGLRTPPGGGPSPRSRATRCSVMGRSSPSIAPSTATPPAPTAATAATPGRRPSTCATPTDAR